MKKFKQFASVLVLSLIFIPSAFAGEIGLPTPTPPPAASTQMTLGEIWIPGTGHSQGSPSKSAGVVALNLLTDLLLMF